MVVVSICEVIHGSYRWVIVCVWEAAAKILQSNGASK
jgi:hypothetical protein